MKQTAVEFLSEALRFTNKEVYAELYDVILNAKEMEKEQMIHFAMDYVNSDSIGCLWYGDSAPELDIDTSAEQYYNRIFNTDNQ